MTFALDRADIGVVFDMMIHDIDVAGRATIEAVLTRSAQELAGPKHPGKKA